MMGWPDSYLNDEGIVLITLGMAFDKIAFGSY